MSDALWIIGYLIVGMLTAAAWSYRDPGSVEFSPLIGLIWPLGLPLGICLLLSSKAAKLGEQRLANQRQQQRERHVEQMRQELEMQRIEQQLQREGYLR